MNQELHQLANALFAAEKILSAGGRLVVDTFHSLEDRIVKLFFRDRIEGNSGSRHLPAVSKEPALFGVTGRGLIKASTEECQTNPRARSAKLRWGIRTGEPVRRQDATIFGLPNLAPIAQFSAGGGC